MSAVTRIMRIFNEEYPGKFSMGTTAKDDDTPSRVKVWEYALKEFEDETILNAALHLVTVRKDWPPDIATVREQCIHIAHGELQHPSGAESWERIKQKMTGDPDLQLSDIEKKALAQTSSIYDLKRSTNPSIDRAHYIKAFDHLVSKRHLDRQTLPEVKALVSKNTPSLPAPESKQLESNEPEDSKVITLEEAREEFGSEIENLKNMLGERD